MGLLGLAPAPVRAATGSEIHFYPRPGSPDRMVGGKFQASADGTTYTDLYTITAQPPNQVWTTVALATDLRSYRYLRYLSPAGSYGNVTEIGFYTGLGAQAVKLGGFAFGSPGSFNNAGAVFTKALDGNINTYFDGATADGNFVGLDQGAGVSGPGKVRFAPRLGSPDRMVGGKFQGSNDASTYTDLYTISATPADGAYTEVGLSADPRPYRYLRYLAPSGSYGNVAEIEFYSGTAGDAVKLSGRGYGTAGSFNNSGATLLYALDGDLTTSFDGPTADGDFVGIDQQGPQMTLTPAGVAAGFTLTTFATGFPQVVGQIGPLGMAFVGTGVMVADYPGNVRIFPADQDGQIAGYTAPSITPAASFGQLNACGLVYLGGTYYLSQQGKGKIIRLNADGTPVTGANAVVASISSATDIAANPVSGHLFVSVGGNVGKIYDVNPATNTSTAWPIYLYNADGLAVSADGNTLYVAQTDDGSGYGNIVAYTIATQAKAWSLNTANPSAHITHIDGLGLGFGTLAGTLFANTNDGEVWQVTLSSGAATLMASGGTRGDFAAPDVSGQGSLLLTQSDRILRLSPFPPPGGASLALLSLSVSPTSVTGGTGATGTVTLTGPAPAGGATVTLLDDSASANVPASVVVGAGTTSATFPVATTAVNAATIANLSAAYGGTTKTAALTINPSAVALTSLAVSPASVTGGTGATGTVTLSGAAPAGGTVVTLSSNKTAAQVPGSVTVPANATTASFPVTTTAVAADTAATLTASLGSVNKTAPLTVKAPTLASVSVSPVSVTGGAGATGTATLTGPAPAGGLTVTLSDNSASASVPASVSIGANSVSATFPVTTTTVSTATTATLQGTLATVSKTAALLINPASACTVPTLNAFTATITGGTVTLSASALTGGAAVDLTSSSPSVIVPSAVLVPAGTSSVAVPLMVGNVSAPIMVTLTATYHGVSKSATVTVTGNPQVPQGGPAVTFPATGTHSTAGGYGIDVINPSGTVVASSTSMSQALNGWTLSTTGSGLATKFTVQAPAGATVATGYEVRSYSSMAASAYFDVTASGSPPSGGSGGGMASGPLTLTAAGFAKGFRLTTFATGLIAPEGVGFAPDGSVLVANGDYLSRLPSDADGQTAPQILSTGNSANVFGLTNIGSVIYGTHVTGNYRSALIQLNPVDGTQLGDAVFSGTTDSGGSPINMALGRGLTANPITGHLYVADWERGIWDIDPGTGTGLLLVDTGFYTGFFSGYQAIACSPDGYTVYVVGHDPLVEAYDTRTGALVFSENLPGGSDPDGVAVGSGSLNGKIYVSDYDGDVSEVDVTSSDYAHNVVKIAQGGNANDVTSVDPNGTFLINQTGSGYNPDGILSRMFPPPGGSFSPLQGQVIATRDDRVHSYAPSNLLSLASPSLTAATAHPAKFDLVGLAGSVAQASMQRAGQITFTTGGRFDLQLGLQSFPASGLATYSLVQADVELAGSPQTYALSWPLPPAFLPDVQNSLGDDYFVSLADQLSSICGTYNLADTPQQGWPSAKNVLTVQMSPTGGRGEIPAGRCLDLGLTGAGIPDSGAHWDIRLSGTIIASAGDPQGWDAEADHTLYHGVTVTVPGGAVPSANYEVRFTAQGAGEYSGSGGFRVAATDMTLRAPLLRPLTLSAPAATGEAALTGTVALDAPAPPEGAAVTLTSSDPAHAAVPGYVTIPAGASTATFSVTAHTVTALDRVQILASYNGYRVASVVLRNTGGTVPAAPVLSAMGGAGAVMLSWTAPSGATSYALSRGTHKGGPYAPLFQGLIGSTFTDRKVVNGTTYYYVVSAFGDYGSSGPSNEAAATPLGGTVAAPQFGSDPPNFTASGSIKVILSDATPLATIRYTLNGTLPTDNSPVYKGPFTLSATATVRAFASRPGFAPSPVASQLYTVTPVVAISVTATACGSSGVAGSLSTSDGWSKVLGPGFYGDDYTFSGTAGATVTLSVHGTPPLDTVLFLLDPSGAVIASSDDGPSPPDPQILATLPATGTYTLEVSTFSPRATGAYTLSLGCAAANPGPLAPSVTLTSPATGSQLRAGVNVTLAAVASDQDGTVAKVEFFANVAGGGAVKIGEDAASPYTLVWAGAAAGQSAVLTARATDNGGHSADSAPVTVSFTSGIASVPIACGQTVAESLAATDGSSANAAFTDGAHFARRYTFTPSVNETVVITLASNSFDPYLTLTGTPSPVSASGSAGAVPGAQLTASLTAGTPYVIEVTTGTAGQTGPFSLHLSCGTAATAAVLAVTSGGTAVPNDPGGTGTPVDFGSTPQGVPVSKILVLTNTGGSDLGLSGLSITGDFQPTTPLPSLLPPGGQASLTLRFGAAVLGTTTATVTLANSSAVNPYKFRIKGTATAPGALPTVLTLTLSPTTVAGGTTSIGTVTLSAAAPSGGLTVSLSTNMPAVATVPGTVTVAPGATTATFTVSTVSVTASKSVVVTASSGGTSKTATLTVNPSGTPPTITLAATPASAAAPATFTLTATVTPAAGTTIRKVEFFAGSTKIGEDAVSPYTFTWRNVPAGSYALTAKVTDSQGVVVTSNTVNVTVTAAPVLTAVISPNGATFTGTQTVTLSATPAGAGAQLYYSFNGADATPLWRAYTLPLKLVQTTTVWAKATAAGYGTSAVVSATFTASNTGTGLSAQITAPASSNTQTGTVTLSAPAAIQATISSASQLAYHWQLAYQLVGDTLWVPFADGDNAGAITGQTLATWDTTLLVNGLYDVQLTAVDTAGNEALALIEVQVQGGQKVGYFTLSYTDLTVPVAGFPLTVTRTYDSRVKTGGDFGVGWTLSTSNIRLQKSPGAIGDGWQETYTGTASHVRPTKPHTVTLTFPDGQVYGFAAVLNPSDVSFDNIYGGTLQWVQQSGPKGASLTPVGASADVYTDNTIGPVELGSADDDGDFLGTFDCSEFLLRTRDGRQFDVKAGSPQSGGGLQSLRDLNGNTLTFSSGGIASTTGTGASGPGIQFQRSAAGFLTGIAVSVGGQTGPMIVYKQDTSNAQGNLISVTDRAGNATTYDYDGQHLLTGIHDPRGLTPLTNYYDASGRLTSSKDAFGKTIIYNYAASLGGTAAANTEVTTDRLGNATTLGYDAYGNVTTTTRYLGARPITTTAQYGDANNPDKKTQEMDALGRETDYAYDALGNLKTVSQYRVKGDLTTKITTTTTVNGYGQPLTVTDPLGHVVATNTYDPNGNLKTTTDALGRETDFFYNGSGTLAQTKDAQGHVTNYGYADPNNPSLVTSVSDAASHVTAFTYDGDGNKKTQTTTRTNAAGQTETLTTQFFYDGDDRLIQTVAPDGATSVTAYTSFGKVDYTTDALNRTTRYAYDDAGQLLSTSYPDGSSTAVTYDANGQRLTSTDKAGRVAGSVYDSLGRVTQSGPVSSYPPGGSPVWLTDGTHSLVTTTTYDDAGQVTAEMDALGRISRSAYDDLGRKSTSTDALGWVTKYEYDDAGRQSKVTDANNHATTYDYDDAGHLTVTHYPDGSTSRTDYDELGRRIAQTDQASHTTRYEYDALGRLWHVTDPMAHVTTFGYDELGQKTSQTDANGHITRFAYDGRGRLLSKMLPLGQTDGRTYDGLGRLATQTDFNGQVTAFGYDPVSGWLLTKTAYATAAAYASSTPTGEGVSFTYNPDGTRHTATRTSAAGTTVTTTYAYYANGNFQQGQLQSVTTATSAASRLISYAYDAVGNKVSTQTPSLVTGNKKVLYAYDADNRLLTVTHPDGVTTTFGYDKAGNRLGVTRKTTGGTVFSTTAYTYDSLNRLTDLVNYNGSGTVLSSYHYGVRADGKRYAVTDASGTTNYTYDDAGKLTQEAGPYATIAYTYDNVGNRLTRTVTNAATGGGTTLNNGATAYTYDGNDRLTTAGHTYDADGNEKTVAGQTAAYDFENHLIGLGTGVASYVYDADGNRTSVTSGGTTTSYVVDASLPYASVVEEYTGTTPALAARYDYGDDLIRMDRTLPAVSTSYYLYDGLGSTRQLVSTTGAVTDTWGYSAFGETASHTGSTTNPFLFNAQQLDGASGDYYLRARYYDQSSGRFISQDPFGGSSEDPITLHRYLYAGNDAVNQTDPGGKDFSLSGLALSIGIGATIGAISGGASEYALTGHVGIHSILVGAALGGALAPAAAASPAIATILGLIGVGSSSGLVYKVFTDPTASAGQKYAAAILLVASVAGTGTAGRQAVRALQNQEQISFLADDIGDGDAGPGTDLVRAYPSEHGFGGPHGYEPLAIGKVLGRYGSEYGSYLTDAGTPEPLLSLNPNGAPREYNEYTVLKPFFADAGYVAGYYGLPGGGRQYYVGGGYSSIPNNANPSGEGEEISIQKLIEWGYLGVKK